MTTHYSTDVLTRTRHSLHRAAEHLVAATRKRATGEFTLVAAPGGVATPPMPDGSVVAIEGAELVVRRADGEQRASLTTLAEAAAAVGIEPGFPWTKAPPGTEYEPHARLSIDADAAADLALWFALGEDALMTLVADVPTEQPSQPQIFPEHFDLGVTAGAVNYGFSPGDEAIPMPYVYVGPHAALSRDPFWNAPFGCYRTWDEITTPEQALEFFHATRAVLGD